MDTAALNELRLRATLRSNEWRWSASSAHLHRGRREFSLRSAPASSWRSSALHCDHRNSLQSLLSPKRLCCNTIHGSAAHHERYCLDENKSTCPFVLSPSKGG